MTLKVPIYLLIAGEIIQQGGSRAESRDPHMVFAQDLARAFQIDDIVVNDDNPVRHDVPPCDGCPGAIKSDDIYTYVTLFEAV